MLKLSQKTLKEGLRPHSTPVSSRHCCKESVTSYLPYHGTRNHRCVLKWWKKKKAKRLVYRLYTTKNILYHFISSLVKARAWLEIRYVNISVLKFGNKNHKILDHFFPFIVVQGRSTWQHLQRFLQCIKYIILKIAPLFACLR
jgi:hypothetical protein